MKRRKFLGVVLGGASASLSGCIDIGDDNQSNNNDPDENTPIPPSNEPIFDSRVEEPDYEISRPPLQEEQWDENYLGQNMPTSPSVGINILENSIVTQPSISFNDRESSNEFVADFFNTRSELSEKIEISQIEEFIGFGKNAVAVIETGFVSSEYVHEWVRMEEVNDGYWIQGYYSKPFMSNPDLSTASSAVVIPKTESGDNPTLYVSLTVSTGTVVNFSSEESVVGVESY